MTLTAQIGLVPHPHTWVEAGIEFVTRAKVHHTIVAISPRQIVGADPLGATVHPMSAYPDAIWSDFDLTEEEQESIVDWTVAHIGTPYNYVDDAALGIALLTRTRTPDWAARRLSSDRFLECAQLADAAYEAAGVHLFDDGRLPGAVYPGSFVPLWKEHGWWPTGL